MSPLKISSVAIPLLLALAACAKKAEPEAAPASAPASEASSTSAAATPAAAAPAEEDPEVAQRKAAVEFALAEQKIAEDPLGQWAVTAKASSTFASSSSGREDEGYSAWQATGAPNVTRYSDASESWASKEADKGVEWLEVDFAKPVHATELRIRQSYGPGAIIKVELIDTQGGKHSIFSGVDEASYPPQTITWFNARTPKTDYLVKGALITLATNAVSGWNEIDAVQLVGE